MFGAAERAPVLDQVISYHGSLIDVIHVTHMLYM